MSFSSDEVNFLVYRYLQVKKYIYLVHSNFFCMKLAMTEEAKLVKSIYYFVRTFVRRRGRVGWLEGRRGSL